MGIYGHMNIILTQDAQAAREVALAMGSSAVPYWWIEQTDITPETYPVIAETIEEIQHLLGEGGLNEFTSCMGYDFSEPYTGQEGVFSLQGFVF